MKKPVILNIMDSSLVDLETKGVFSSIPRSYNPNGAYSRVLHFTPHAKDLQLAARLEEHDIKIIVHPVSGLSPLKAIKTTFRMWKMIKDEKVALVRGRLPYLGSLMGVIAARLGRRPFVVSLGGDNRIVQERNNVYNYNSKRISYFIEKLVLQLATRIIVPNRFTQGYVKSIIGSRASRQKCVRIPWISDPVEKALPLPYGTSDPGPDTKKHLVVIIGFLNKYKYTDILFDVLETFLKTAPEKNTPVQFVFCGDGPLRETGEKRFSDNPDIRFPGWTKREDVQDLMRKADIILVPMSGFVLLEAASLGKAVITSNVEWHTEMIIDHKTGLAVSPKDITAWLKAIRYMLDNPGKAKEMGRHLEELYWREYDPEKTIASEIDLYNDLVKAYQK